MNKRPICGESPTAANERQAVAPQDEDPLPSASASASLAQEVPPLSIPNMPPHLTADLILPFVADRSAWNSVCSASKDSCRAAKKMTPPWPNKAFNNLEHPVCHVAFSPSGLQLAFCINSSRTCQFVVHVWDRWGKETLLGGHTEHVCCLEHSLDGKHLASGSAHGDGSIRIWHAESFHAASSHPHRERSTPSTKQADKILLGSRSVSATLSFSRTDSNLLASGGSNGEIKVWNVAEQTCVHSFDPNCGAVRSLFFAGGADIACIALAGTGSVIRFWRAEGSSDFESETIGNADAVSFRPVFSPSGSFVAASVRSRTGDGFASRLVSHDLETMAKTQSGVMPGFVATCLAVSPDGKRSIVVSRRAGIQLLQTDDFSIQRDMDATGEGKPVSSIAFDPTCRILAIGGREGSLELQRLQMSTQRSAIYLSLSVAHDEF